jgi:predicted RNA-binding Zn-ribbon protein involved in translation (DUF1610 family)
MAKPMMCTSCGIPMNHHAEKLVEPTSAAEAKKLDPILGGLIEEVHTCPGCGRVASRHAEWNQPQK